MPKRTSNATAVWTGTLKDGEGRFEGASGAFSAGYSAGTRFEDEAGTNPEELLAAAEAACFSMAFSVALQKNGTPPDRIESRAACTIEQEEGGWRVTRIDLTVRGEVPGADEATFREIAAQARDGCPVSGALRGNVEITLDARLS